MPTRLEAFKVDALMSLTPRKSDTQAAGSNGPLVRRHRRHPRVWPEQDARLHVFTSVLMLSASIAPDWPFPLLVRSGDHVGLEMPG